MPQRIHNSHTVILIQALYTHIIYTHYYILYIHIVLSFTYSNVGIGFGFVDEIGNHVQLLSHILLIHYYTQNIHYTYIHTIHTHSHTRTLTLALASLTRKAITSSCSLIVAWCSAVRPPKPCVCVCVCVCVCERESERE
jgi:hypothetical protein